MYPALASSRVITRRRIVVFPEPDGPIRVTRSPLFTEKFRSWSTTWSPKRFSTSSNRIAGVPLPVPALWGSRCVGKALFQSANQQGGGVGGEQEDDTGQRDRLGVAEVGAAVGLCGAHELGERDREQERGVLEHRDHVVPE